jgi:hypothetical protein
MLFLFGYISLTLLPSARQGLAQFINANQSQVVTGVVAGLLIT